MMRLAGFLTLLALTGAYPASAQSSAGSELWRLAAVTIPLPVALASGAAAAYWNPAQTADRGQIGVDLIQTPQAISATGVVAAVRLATGPLGGFGVVYARMGLGDLIHTTDSPDPDGSVPFFTQRAALTWARGFGTTTVGVAGSYLDTRLDGTTVDRWALDIGLSQRFGDRLRLAAATRGLRRVGSDPAQDVSAGVEFRFWRGPLWRNAPGSLLARYGIELGHPGGVDHQFGLGMTVGAPLALDVVLAREASYGSTAWRGAAGFRVAVGRYRMSFSRDGGVSDLGSSFRVGLEAMLR
jgi:hypothetical protein